MTDGARRFSAVLRRPRRSLRLWLVVLAVLFGVLLLPYPPYPQPVHAQDTQSLNAISGNLHGTVINSVTREPVARALVFSPDNRVAKFTDDQGRFEFQLSRTDSVQLMARKPGFLEGGIAGLTSLKEPPTT